MTELFKTFEIPDEPEPTDEPAYGTSWIFDFDRGDFLEVAGRTPEAEGHHAWVQWCVKTVLTQRYAFIIYDDDYGVDMRGISEAVNAEDVAEQEIRSALLADPRTADVSEFEFERAGDKLEVAFTIEPTVGTTERVSIEIGGN